MPTVSPQGSATSSPPTYWLTPSGGGGGGIANAPTELFADAGSSSFASSTLDLSDYITSEQLSAATSSIYSAISAATPDLSTYITGSQLAAAIAGIATTSINQYFATTTLSYATTTQLFATTNVTNNITYATTTLADLSSYLTSSQVASAIVSAAPDLTQYAKLSNLSSFVSTSSLVSTLGIFATNASLTAAVASATSTLYSQILALIPAAPDLSTYVTNASFAATLSVATSTLYQSLAALVASSVPNLSGYLKTSDFVSGLSVATSSLNLSQYATNTGVAASIASATSTLNDSVSATNASLSSLNVLVSSNSSQFSSLNTSYFALTTSIASTTSTVYALSSLLSSSYVTNSQLASSVSAFATNDIVAGVASTLNLNLSAATSSLYSAITAASAQMVANLHGTVTGDIIPNADNAYTLGTSANRFTNIYAKYINAGDVTFTETSNPAGTPSHTFVAGDALGLFVTTTAGSTHTVPVDFVTAINIATANAASNIYFSTSGSVGIGIASTTPLKGKLDVEAAIASGDSRLFTLSNTSGANGNAALAYSAYIPSATGDLNLASNDNGNGGLINLSYSAWDLKLGGESDAFSLSRSPSVSQKYASLFNVTNAGNVGIGTTSPFAQLSVATPNGATGSLGTLFAIASSTASATTTVFSVSNTGLAQILGGLTAFASSTIGGGTQASGLTISGGATTTGTAYFAGNVGIGTTSPLSALSVSNTSASAQFTLAYDQTRYSQLYTNSAGDLILSASGGNARLLNQNLYVCSGGACPAATIAISGTGNLQVNNRLIAGSLEETCPSGYIWVPGESRQGTLPGFCTMKYDASNNGSGVAVSVPGSAPWVSISQTSAIAQCQALGPGYHLMNEPEWMTIADEITALPINDITGSTQFATGHSDNSPGNALTAGTSNTDPVISGCNLMKPLSDASNAYVASSCEQRGTGSGGSTDNDKGYYGTGNQWSSSGYVAGASNKSQLRTFILPTGAVIWDMAGNVWQWTDAYDYGSTEGPLPNDAWTDYSAVTNYKALYYARPDNPAWNAASNGIGQIYSPSTASVFGFIRGGPWVNGSLDGVFTLSLNTAPSYVSTYLGFRCSR